VLCGKAEKDRRKSNNNEIFLIMLRGTPPLSDCKAFSNKNENYYFQYK
jgi:hypothetical protein